MSDVKKCDVPACEKLRADNGQRRLCRMHKWRLATHGLFELPARHGPSAQERFWAKVNKGAPNGCWEWTASRTKKGYGHFGFNGRTFIAHRFVLMMQGHEIPEDMAVCHRCDNPPCVNPEHLFIGTNQDNVDDMVSKGRHHGRNPAKLTPEKVLEARLRATQGESHRSIARSMGVASTTLSYAVNGTNWSWV